MKPEDRERLVRSLTDNLNDEGYQDLVELATFCLATGTSLWDAYYFNDALRNAFIEAHNEYHKEGK